MSSDRRAHERVPVQVFVAWSQGHRAGSWTTIDLSVGGLMAQTERELDPDQPVLLRVRSGSDLVLHLRAHVRRQIPPTGDSPGGYGLEFVDLTPVMQDSLRRLLHRVRTGEVEEEELSRPLPTMDTDPEPASGRSDFWIKLAAAGLLGLATALGVVAAVLALKG